MITVETGQQRLSSDCFDLPSLLENIARSKAEQAAIKDVEIISFIDPSTPAIAKGDPDRLHQIVMSLVGYAVDCGDHRDVSIQVKAEEKTKSYSIVNFSISFYCSEALAGRLQAIQRDLKDLDDSHNPDFDGNDSGLFTSQRILQQMGSTMRVTAFPEKESTLSFSMKFEQGPQLTTHEPGMEFNGVRVLVVDDNPTSQQALTTMLTAMGCRVKTVTSGREVHPALARGLITNVPYRVVFLDMQMPVMNGESVLGELRQDEMTRNTKVIIMIPVGHPVKLESISELGYSGSLLKPFRRSELREVLKSTLGLRQETPRGNNSMMKEKLAGSRDVQNLKILLVEDDELGLKMGSILLGHLGHTVDVAFSGAEALKKIEMRDYDLVFMDVQMPEMSGMEATRRIRALKNDKKNIPIIALSAHDINKYEQLCLEAGMDDYISKPFKIERINQIIAAYVEGHYRKGLKSPKVTETRTLPVEPPLLDVSAGMPIFDNNAKQYGKFLNEFLAGLPKRLEIMADTLHAKDWEVLGNEAHSLKGISANLGAMKVSSQASRLEAAAREQTEEPAQSCLHDLGGAISELNNQAPNILSTLKTSRKKPKK